MNIFETLLVYLGIPVAVFVGVFAVVLGPSAVKAPRYRAGQPWNFEPVWYLPHPGVVSSAEVSKPATATGGASGEW